MSEKLRTKSWGARYLKRSLTAFAPCFLLCFMFLIWGPMEVYLSNLSDFSFSFWRAMLPLSLCAAAVSFAAAFLIGLTRRRIYRLLTGLIAGFTLACYIQLMFLNLDIGILTGEKVNWDAYGSHGAVNLLIFSGIVLVVIIAAQVFRRMWRRVLPFVCTALFAVQFTTFCVLYVRSIPLQNRAKAIDYVLSGTEQLTVAPDGNVLVFVLDNYPNTYFEQALKAFPEAAEPFSDFTYYSNCDPTYLATFPSMTHLMTGYPYDAAATIDDWFKSAWNSDSANSFYALIKSAGYTTRLYTSSAQYMGLMYAADKIDNLVDLSQIKGEVVFDDALLIETMLKMSCYRYLPHQFKRYFTLRTGDFRSIQRTASDTLGTVYNKTGYASHLRASGLTVGAPGEKLLMIEHLGGTHMPYIMNEQGVYVADATRVQTAAGNLAVIRDYMAQLRALGLYDDATIIVTSDHGEKETDMQALYLIKEPGAKHDRMIKNDAPISHTDFLGTLLANMGIKDETVPRTAIYDFDGNDERVRTVMRNYIDRNYPRVGKYNSTVLGTHTVMYEYSYEGNRRDLVKQVHRGPTGILPLRESFN